MQVRPSKRPSSSDASRPARPAKAKRALTPVAAGTPPWQRPAMAPQRATSPWASKPVAAASPFAKDASGAPVKKEAIAPFKAKQPVPD